MHNRPNDHQDQEPADIITPARRIGRVALGLAEVVTGVAFGWTLAPATAGYSVLLGGVVAARGLLRFSEGVWGGREAEPQALLVARQLASMRPVALLLGVADVAEASIVLATPPIALAVGLPMTVAALLSAGAGVIDSSQAGASLLQSAVGALDRMLPPLS